MISAPLSFIMPNTLRHITETEKAYWAGFVDGEGIIRVKKETPPWSRSPIYNLTIAIANTNNANKEALRELGAHIIERAPGKPGDLPSWAAEFQGTRAARFLEDIIPYLKNKKVDAQLGIEFQRVKEETKSYGPLPLSSEIIEKRDYFYRALLKGYPQKGYRASERKKEGD